VLKRKIRKKILKLRKIKSNNQKKINYLKLLNIFEKYFPYKGIVGGYYPINYEIDDLDILRKLELKKYKISLPVISKKNHMDFYTWSFKNTLQVNQYGIPEPSKKKLVYPDILLIPLVAFDNRRFRLGYGGGFYDRYITRIKNKKKFITIGLAFDFQKVKRLPINKFDKKLDIVLTNKKIYK